MCLVHEASSALAVAGMRQSPALGYGTKAVSVPECPHDRVPNDL
jgi:hypothetical protein